MVKNLPATPTLSPKTRLLPRLIVALSSCWHKPVNALRLLTVSGLASLLLSCASLPNKPAAQADRVSEEAMRSSTLATLFAPADRRTTGESGNYLLRHGHDALIERLHLIALAEQQIDVQYFLWNDDRTGRLFLQKLMQAAERGVYVRILIDGFSIADRNKQLAFIDSHPNIDVRIYNPFVARSRFGRILNLLFDFNRLNHRMHNKALIVDGSAAITGGRNIGDAYFEYATDVNFIDADVFSVGPVVPEIMTTFQRYWDSTLAIPTSELVKKHPLNTIEGWSYEAFLARDLSFFLKDNQHLANNDAIIEHYRTLSSQLIWANTYFVADDAESPATKHAKQVKAVAEEIANLVANSERNVLIESAYFVLDQEAIDFVKSRTDKGIRMQTLTNSLASNNLVPNHAGYAKMRQQMLESGIELYELKPEETHCTTVSHDCKTKIALHAKTAVFDNRLVYVGSLNFNLRSAFLNTESGLFIDSPIMAKELTRQIKDRMNLFAAWQPIMLGDRLLWITFADDKIKQTRIEPDTTALERVEVDLLTAIPGTEYF